MSERVVVTGAAHVLLDPNVDPAVCDPAPFLRSRKSQKYMGLQDCLAVVSAGRALASAGLDRSHLAERAGLYLAVGYLSFEERDIVPVLDQSVEDGRFSMHRFGTEGIRRAHPLLTFRCLPNMPAYHVSVNFDVRGPYLVTYPGPGQFYQSLDAAYEALIDQRVEYALVGAVANQRNFLVAHHFSRIADPVPKERLRDVGACLVLERQADARARGATLRATLNHCDIRYTPFDCETDSPRATETYAPSVGRDGNSEFGPAGLPVALSSRLGSGTGALRHEMVTRDGFTAFSEWELH